MDKEQENQRNNFDLDVANALKDFPKDDMNGFIYLRAYGPLEEIETTQMTSISSHQLSALIFIQMSENEGFAESILNSCLNYFRENKDKKKVFKKILKML